MVANSVCNQFEGIQHPLPISVGTRLTHDADMQGNMHMLKIITVIKDKTRQANKE